MIRIAVICPSEIAERRFLPALSQNENFQFVGLGTASPKEWFGEKLTSTPHCTVDEMKSVQYEKAQGVVNQYGGRIFDSYNAVVTSPDIDAVYLPLPPALHYKWGKLALENGMHVFLEKPFTTNLNDTEELIKIASDSNLALQENYMFQYHSQLQDIENIVRRGDLGDVRLYRISFGFPMRTATDFRYKKHLGGGAILDCGGYTIKYASMLLGPTARIVHARSNYIDDFDVDMFGSAVMVNEDGVTAHLSFGMDNSYKCELEIWGSKACLSTNRVLTAPAGFVPEVILTDSRGNETKIALSADDSFGKSIKCFEDCINSADVRQSNYKNIERQSYLLDQFMNASQINTNK